MSRAESLIAAVEVRLMTLLEGASVTVAGRAYAYRTDFGHKVFLRRQTPLAEGEPYMLNIVPGVPQPVAERGEFGLDRYRLDIGLQLMARGGRSVSGKDAAEMVALGTDDVRQAVRSDRRWGGLARSSSLEAVGPDAELQAALAAQKIYAIELMLSIEYTVNAGEV